MMPLSSDDSPPPSQAIKMVSCRQLSPLSTSLPTYACHAGEASPSPRTETTKRCPLGPSPWLESPLRGVPQCAFHWRHRRFSCQEVKTNAKLGLCPPTTFPFHAGVFGFTMFFPQIKNVEIFFLIHIFKLRYCST